MLTVDLKCQYNDFILIIEQQLPTNKIIGLFGSSGSGKSRLLRQLVGLDQVFQKKCFITFNKNSWNNSNNNIAIATSKRGIGYLPQSIDLFPHLTVMQNILFGYNFKNTELKYNQIFIDEMIEQLDLKAQVKKMPYQLSGGQQQRVALARAILAGSNLLVLDEPLSAIGEEHKPKVMQLLKRVNKEFNTTIIFSSHNRYEHAFLTDYLLTFKNGSIKQHGNYQQVATDISGEFSQQSDAINHITATVIEFEEQFSVNRLRTNSHLLWAGNKSLEKNSVVNLEIKAQDISLFLKQTEETSILNNLNVKLVDFRNTSDHQVIIKLAFEDNFLTAFITKKSFCQLNLQKEQTLYAKFKSVSVLPLTLIVNNNE